MFPSRDMSHLQTFTFKSRNGIPRNQWGFKFDMMFLLLFLVLARSPFAEASPEASCLLQSKVLSAVEHNPNDYSKICTAHTSCICDDRLGNLNVDLTSCAAKCVDQPGFAFVSESDPIEGKMETCACCTSLASISKVSLQSPSWAATFMYV